MARRRSSDNEAAGGGAKGPSRPRASVDRTIGDGDGLFREFAITRVGDLTGLDTIGIPIWFACRPNGRSLSKPLVFMPTFGGEEPAMQPFDDLNAEIWSSLGFEVVRVGGWSALAIGGGALRCASKVLKRGGAAGDAIKIDCSPSRVVPNVHAPLGRRRRPE